MNQKHDFETALMLRVAQGDAEAMTVLFRHAWGDVCSLCARLSLDDDAAEDLAQETFMRVLRSAHGFRGDARFSTWVYRIVCNVCSDHRAARARARRPLPIADDVVESDPGRVAVLRRALERLTDAEREAVVLSRLRDQPYRQLAETLGCTEGAARVRVHRALERLRIILLQMEAADAL